MKCSSFWAVKIAVICWKEHRDSEADIWLSFRSLICSECLLTSPVGHIWFTASGIKHAVITPLQTVRQRAMKDCTPNSVMTWFLHLPCMAFLCHSFCFLPPPRPFCHELHGCVKCKQEVTGNVEVLTCSVRGVKSAGEEKCSSIIWKTSALSPSHLYRPNF